MINDDTANACTLISASCTSGWFDWIHGEFWVCPDGILRRSLGFRKTLGHGKGRTLDPANRPLESFGRADISRIVAADRRNRWITWGEIGRATLKRGIVDHSLHLDRSDGSHAKLLWLRADGGYDLLEEALTRLLPGRFTAIDKAFSQRR